MENYHHKSAGLKRLLGFHLMQRFQTTGRRTGTWAVGCLVPGHNAAVRKLSLSVKMNDKFLLNKIHQCTGAKSSFFHNLI